MEKQLKESFENLTMPEGCQARIQAAMAEKRRKTRPGWVRVAAMAAMLALVVLMGFHFDTLRVCAERAYEHIVHPQDPEATEAVGRIGGDTYVSYGGVVVQHGEYSGKVNEKLPAEVRDGRLHFIANGENIDITDECSMERAYIYTMEDITGALHYIVVGGTPENWGYQIIIRDTTREGTNPEGWVGGGGSNYCGEDSDWEPYGWVKDAKERIGHPWPI